jgi:hypothetical protein
MQASCAQQVQKGCSQQLKSSITAKPRAILTEEQAIAIFKLKLRASDPNAKPICSETVARAYNIGEKTVRDIWSGRTWNQETLHLEPSRPARRLNPPGRPMGRKDQKPRKCPGVKSLRTTKQVADSTNSEDPFHDDWPNWARAEVYTMVWMPPNLLYTSHHSKLPTKQPSEHQIF